jgi:putative transposase
MDAVNHLATDVGLARACQALRVPRSSVYRADERQRHLGTSSRTVTPRPTPPLALRPAERTALQAVLCSERFADCAPATIYATLLDEGIYLGSVRTMYRLLKTDGQSRERRAQLTHPVYSKPELLATGPNEVWSWDITKLRGPLKWSYFHLYVILDIFSRYVVGWMIAPRESAELAEQLIADSIAKQGVEPNTLTLHADRGSSMRSKVVAQLLVDLEVAKSHSRPYVSDDNPFSESNFKTLKYRPEFPDRFGCIEDARAHCQRFFHWYNDSHRHAGIGLMTPHSVHHGLAKDMFKLRASTLVAAFADHPNRFKGQCPQPPKLPIAAWINPPKRTGADKRGDTYLRTLLIHGARAVLAKTNAPSPWLQEIGKRRPPNVVIVALANKMARTIWAVLAHGRAFDKEHVSVRPNMAVPA